MVSYDMDVSLGRHTSSSLAKSTTYRKWGPHPPMPGGRGVGTGYGAPLHIFCQNRLQVWAVVLHGLFHS